MLRLTTRSGVFSRSTRAVTSPIESSGSMIAPIQPEVIRPLVLSGVEQRDQFARRRQRGDVRTLIAIADHTGVRGVARNSRTLMLLADYVVDFVRERRVVFVK